RRMFGIAFLAFGLQQLLFGDFVPGRPPAWALDFPGRLICIYATGVCFIVCGAAIVADRRVRLAALIVAVLVLAGAVVRNVAPALADHSFGGAWTRLGKAVALCGGARRVRHLSDRFRHSALSLYQRRAVARAGMDSSSARLDDGGRYGAHCWRDRPDRAED